MSNWRLAESLKQLRKQTNAAYPNRDKTSDGSIGDTKHSARISDHNPNQQGVVTAIDIDEDLNGEGTLEDIVTAIRKSRDKRVKYIIYEGRITAQGSDLQRWKKYTGANAHKHHAHISVHSDWKLYDSTAEWSITTPKVSAVEQPTDIPLENPRSKPAVIVSEPAVNLPEQAQPPTVPPVVEVEQVTAELEAEKEVSGIQASTAGAATFITTTLGGVLTFLSGYGWQVVIGIAIFGAVFVIARFWYANREKERQAAERREREQRAHDMQMATLKSAMEPSLQAVRVVPKTEGK